MATAALQTQHSFTPQVLEAQRDLSDEDHKQLVEKVLTVVAMFFCFGLALTAHMMALPFSAIWIQIPAAVVGTAIGLSLLKCGKFDCTAYLMVSDCIHTLTSLVFLLTALFGRRN